MACYGSYGSYIFELLFLWFAMLAIYENAILSQKHGEFLPKWPFWNDVTWCFWGCWKYSLKQRPIYLARMSSRSNPPVKEQQGSLPNELYCWHAVAWHQTHDTSSKTNWILASNFMWLSTWFPKFSLGIPDDNQGDKAVAKEVQHTAK